MMYYIICLLFFVTSINAQLNFGGKLYTFQVQGHNAFVVEPIVKIERRPWIWYAPTLNKYPDSTNIWLLEKLVQNGFWICGVDIGESYGNKEGQKIYSCFYDSLILNFKLDKKACFVAQSRGGLMLYNWAENTENSQKVSRIAGIYPVGDLLSYPGAAIASKAYGYSEDEFISHIKEFNPIDNLLPLYEAGVKIFHLHGNNDLIVPLCNNSQVIYNRYSAFGGDITLKIIENQGHTLSPLFFQSHEMLSFLLEELSQNNNMIFKTIDTIICKGSLAFLSGKYRSEEGSYFDTIDNYPKYKMIIKTNLRFYPPGDLTVIDTSVCIGETYWTGMQFQTDPGIYYDTLKNVYGCDSIIQTLLSFRECSTSITDAYSRINGIEIYPSPTTRFVNIKSDNHYFVQVYNLSGQLIIVSDKNTIDLQNFADGIYLMKITDTNNNYCIRKIIYQRE